MDTSPRPVSINPDTVIVPLGNVHDVTVIRVDDGTTQKKPKRRYVRRVEKEQDDG